MIVRDASPAASNRTLLPALQIASPARVLAVRVVVSGSADTLDGFLGLFGENPTLRSLGSPLPCASLALFIHPVAGRGDFTSTESGVSDLEESRVTRANLEGPVLLLEGVEAGGLPVPRTDSFTPRRKLDTNETDFHRPLLLDRPPSLLRLCHLLRDLSVEDTPSRVCLVSGG